MRRPSRVRVTPQRRAALPGGRGDVHRRAAVGIADVSTTCPVESASRGRAAAPGAAGGRGADGV